MWDGWPKKTWRWSYRARAFSAFSKVLAHPWGQTSCCYQLDRRYNLLLLDSSPSLFTIHCHLKRALSEVTFAKCRLLMVFQLWADVQLYLMKWWHWQHWWRCNAIQELQILSDIASSAKFETDHDDEEGEMLMTNKSLLDLKLQKGMVTKIMNDAPIFSWVATFKSP